MNEQLHTQQTISNGRVKKKAEQSCPTFYRKQKKKAICWSHGIALLYIFWYTPDHNEIPLTNEVEAWDTKGELRSYWAGLSRGHEGLQAQLRYPLCLAAHLAMPLSPDICHGHAASVISIRSSETTNWNPRRFTCNSIIPDLGGNTPDTAGHRDQDQALGWDECSPRCSPLP